ncbi:MAG: glycosyl transferase [Chloroflexi bacterium]|nr:glycosyl transferase [Chloroflexota bacterium]|tara:strand:- start:12610 stop:13197 length:588 start_codon:yes stop_codon:yes gene_type:complete
MIKRIFDILSSLLAILAFIPIYLLVAILVYYSLGWPIIYKAKRAGKYNKEFTLIKFRSMKNSTNHVSHHSGDDDPRITKTGKFIRQTKLDELPQLFNVLFGKMSIVGPRPETPEYIKLYSKEQMKILSIRPGITDFASIEFSNLGDILKGDDPDKLYFEKVWDKKMKLRMKYTEEHNFFIDMKIIFSTIMAIFKK